MFQGAKFSIFTWALFIIVTAVGCFTKATTTTSRETTSNHPQYDTFHEDLFIKPLADGKLFAQFKFTTNYRKDIKNLRWENNFQIFPLSLGDLVATTDLNQLHFSLTKGNWNYRNWGYASRPSAPGAQIRVQFSPHNENPEKSWTRLVNSLAGKFCASLASADKQILVASKIVFVNHHSSTSSSNSTEPTYYANLPEETLCTENLTPWKKLLPCYSKSGLASLLNAVNLLKSSYSSLAIDIEPVSCIPDENGRFVFGCEQVQLVQTVNVVFNPLILFEGKQSWSLIKIFGNPIARTCRWSSHSRIHVDITDLDDKSKLYPKNFKEHLLNIDNDGQGNIVKRVFATFDVNAILQVKRNSSVNQKPETVNVGIKQNKIFKQPPLSSRSKIPVNFRTHIAGVGASDGTIVATISNGYDQPTRVTYMSVMPHFLRIYLHTLMIRTKSGQELKPDKLNFVLSKEKKPTLIEFSLVIPAASDAQVSYDFERAFLRWTDYKPDANKGVLIGSSLIGVALPNGGLKHLVFPINSMTTNTTSMDYKLNDEVNVFKIYARPLLIILPTPDFSMPYNVICLVCTSLVALIGMIHSVTTRKPLVKAKMANESASEKKESQKID